MATHVYSFTKVTSEIYRPLLPIVIINPISRASLATFGLLDTGADDCLFPKFIAETLGHDLKGPSAVYAQNQGIGETKVDLWKHPFKIQLLSPDRRSIVWKSKDCLIGCNEHDNAPILLGFMTFLCNFKIVFNYPTKKILVEMN